MDARKAAEPALASLNSVSNAARWKLLFDLVAYAILVLEQLWDVFRADIDATIKSQKVPTLPWWAWLAKQFQWSATTAYPLQVDAMGQVSYVTPDDSAKIIAYAAASRRSVGSKSYILLKVAAQNNGLPEPLTAPQKAAFEAYVNAAGVAFVPVQVTSLAADKIRLYGDLYIHPSYDQVAVLAAVDAAVAAYLNTDLNAPERFDGLLYKEAVQDVVNNVPGVVSFVFNMLTVNTSAVAIDRVYELVAGYCQLDDAALPSITLTPYISAI